MGRRRRRGRKRRLAGRASGRDAPPERFIDVRVECDPRGRSKKSAKVTKMQRDDLTASYADARRLSELIPGGRLVTVASGGHLNLGHREEVDCEIRSYLEEQRPELTRSSASSAWKSGTS